MPTAPASRLNLTRLDARARAALLRVDSYDVALDFVSGDVTFGSVTTVRFRALEPGGATFIDLVSDDVDRIVLNGQDLDPAVVHDGARITLEGLAADNELHVRARCPYMHTGEGLHRFVDPVDGSVYLYSQFQVADARRAFAVFDQPDLKAAFTFTVTAPAGWQVVSNEPTPEPEPATDGAAIWRFPPTPPLPSYVTALVAGPYHRVDGEYRNGDRVVPLGVFCRASLAAHLDSDVIIEETRQGLEFFEAAFDWPYPFAKYDQLFVPDYNSGAMENAGCVTLNEDYVFRSRVPEVSYERRAITILHEIAHMWFGDLVTMTWWDDLWLNESFAEWISTLCAAEATRWHSAWATFANTDKTWAYRQDQLPSTHPIWAEIHDVEDVEVNFDGITYAKGAAVLKLLAAWVGREDFLAGIREYFREFAWGNTTLSDLLGSLERVSGRDLKSWSADWLETAGVNTLHPELAVDDDGRYTAFTVVQTAPEAWPTLRPHRLAIGLYDRVGNGLVRRDRVELDVTGARTDVPQLVGVSAPDLVLLNDDDLTYAKVRLDDRSLSALMADTWHIADTLPRALCWASAWDMTRDAELATHGYLDLVLAGVGTESDSSVVRTLLRQAESATLLYSAPERRTANRRKLAEGLHGLMGEAAPGSDSQLQLVRAFASAAVTDDQLAKVRALREGTEQLEGLTVDTDLRWHLLHQLVAAGKAGDAEIEGDLAADNTATGRRQAATARAARPTAEAKAEAWSSVVDSDELPNSIQVAVIGGFAQPDQLELIRPYVAAYFDSLVKVWDSRTNETAQSVVVGLFPILLADEPTLQAADAWLDANPTAAPALRRLVREGRDGVARALRAQAMDGMDARD